MQKLYANTVAQLKALADDISQQDDGDRAAWSAALNRLYNYTCSTKEAASTIVKLAADSHQEARNLAAQLICYLWQYWKIIPYDFDAKRQSNERIREHTQSLLWTIPLLKSLLQDRAVRPLDTALYAIWEMENAPSSILQQLRQLALKLTSHPSMTIRLSLVRTLCHYYPSDREARYILDEPALAFFVASTARPEEAVRDAACFELWLTVANLNDDVGKAFLTAIEREATDSEVYLEAVIGAARMGVDPDRIDALIQSRLASDDFGLGWVDAAEQSHTETCLLTLLAAYSRISAEDAEDERLENIKAALSNWNEI